MDLVEARRVAYELLSGADVSAERLCEIADRQQRASSELRAAALAAGGATLFGAGTLGRQALAEARRGGLPVKQVIDNRASPDGSQTLASVPVRPPAVIESNDVVFIAVGQGAAAIRKQLKTSFGVDGYGLDRLFHLLGQADLAPTGYVQELIANADRYPSLHRRLGDARSQETLLAVVTSRLLLDEKPLIDVRVQDHAQWFETPFFSPDPDHVFVDGGAFDGDTVRAFLLANGGPALEITAFEPDAALASAFASRYHDDPRIRIVAAGLSSDAGRARFAGTALTNGYVLDASAKDDGVEVPLTSVDLAVDRPISYLKLDVEGQEENALVGARRHLRADRPRLAIAVYHRPHDIWRLPELVDELLPGCRHFLRHYTETSFETVLYALP